MNREVCVELIDRDLLKVVS